MNQNDRKGHSRRIYLDNSATSWPKPAGVYEAMMRYAQGDGVAASAGRGGYVEAMRVGKQILKCRERICQLINGQDASHVVFTLNASDALNLAIKGLIVPGRNDHAVTTWMAHNSVLRPLNALVSQGDSEQTRIECDPNSGLVDPEKIGRAITRNTRVVAMVHGSNVTGGLLAIEEVGRICKEKGVVFLVDAAQTLGHLPIDVRKMHIDLLAFPGHKGLLGPLGTGGLYIRPGVEKKLRTWREGGTGSVSELDTQPDMLPDKYEAGSHNAIGIIGLSEGVQWILDQGVERLWQHEQTLIVRTIERLAGQNGAYPGLRLVGPDSVEHRCGVFSVTVEGLEPQELSAILEEHYGILTRSGLHCAPLAHRTMGTANTGGTTRFSYSAFTTLEEVDAMCDALEEICRAQVGATAKAKSSPVATA